MVSIEAKEFKTFVTAEWPTSDWGLCNEHICQRAMVAAGLTSQVNRVLFHNLHMRAASATTPQEFAAAMDGLAACSQDGHDHIRAIPLDKWAVHARKFNCHGIINSNMSEVSIGSSNDLRNQEGTSFFLCFIMGIIDNASAWRASVHEQLAAGMAFVQPVRDLIASERDVLARLNVRPHATSFYIQDSLCGPYSLGETITVNVPDPLDPLSPDWLVCSCATTTQQQYDRGGVLCAPRWAVMTLLGQDPTVYIRPNRRLIVLNTALGIQDVLPPRNAVKENKDHLPPPKKSPKEARRKKRRKKMRTPRAPKNDDTIRVRAQIVNSGTPGVSQPPCSWSKPSNPPPPSDSEGPFQSCTPPRPVSIS